MPDVVGTMWLDARTFELRFVEFRYTLLPPFDGADKVGGEVHFGKLTNGAWVTSRWFMRFPQFARSVSPVESYTRVPAVTVRPTMHRLVEEGGMVFTAGLRHFLRPAAVAGTVTDSAGGPFPGVTVRLGGAPFTTTTAENGQFRLDSLPPGRFALIAEHPSYTQAGSFVASDPVELTEGDASRVNIRAPTTNDLVEKLCEGKLPKKGNGTLRVIVVDSVTARPLPSLRVWLRWAGRFVGTMEKPESLIPSMVGGTESLTDASGTVTFCDLPDDVRLVFSAVKLDGKPTADSTYHVIRKGELKVSTVRTGRPNE
jgi:hypothetical protein